MQASRLQTPVLPQHPAEKAGSPAVFPVRSGWWGPAVYPSMIRTIAGLAQYPRRTSVLIRQLSL